MRSYSLTYSRACWLFLACLFGSLIGSTFASTASGTASASTRFIALPSPDQVGRQLLLGSKAALDFLSSKAQPPSPKTRFPTKRHLKSPALIQRPNTVVQPLSYYLRVALAGGVAGATGTCLLYPIDSAKT
jgi:hypothetical protein